MGAAHRLTEHCNAKEFAERLEKELFTPLPAKPSVERLDQAKLQTQALYQEYRKTNQCRGTLVRHDCVVDVYNRAVDRLYTIEPRIAPKPRRQSPSTNQPTLPQEASPEEAMANTLRSFRYLIGGQDDD